MSTIKTTNITHGSNTGTNNLVLTDTGNVTVGADLIATKQNGCERIVLEQFYSPCDGSVIALQDGNHTITDVTGTQQGTTSFADCTGSSITYTPPAGTTQVIYEYRVMFGYTDGSIIAHFRIMVDSDEVTYGRHQMMNYTHPTYYDSVKWGFNIGGSADTDVGRLASWTSDKTIKVQWREYSSSNEARLHNIQHWDGSGADLLAKPQLSITAIG